MKINPEESLVDWSERVRQYEYGYSLMQLAEGNPINIVMDQMARRIVNKINHHIITNLNKEKPNVKRS